MAAFKIQLYLLLWTFASVAAGQSLSLNEFLPAPLTGRSEFIELIWNGGHNLDSAEIRVRDSRPNWRSVGQSILIAPGEIIVLAQHPGDFVSIPSTKAHVFTLDTWPALNNTGDSVLVAIDTLIVDAIGYSARDVRPGVSRERNGSSNSWGFSVDPMGSTPGRQNSLPDSDEDWPEPPSASDLLFTEIMFDPLSDSNDHIADQIEFLELLNRSGRPVNLKHLWMSSLPDENGSVDSLSLTSANVVLQPDSLALVFQFNSSAGSAWPGSALLDPWPGAQLSKSTLLPVSRRLGLSNQGEFIVIRNAEGKVVAEAWFHPDLHHPVIGTGKGVSLERISSGRLPGISDPFSSSPSAEGATPGYLSGGTSEDAPVSDVSLSVRPSSFYPERRDLSFQTLVSVSAPRSAAHHIAAIDVYDGSGVHRRVLTLGRLFSESMTVIWDGRDDRGRFVPTGFYIILAQIMSANGGQTRRIKRPVSVIR